MPKGAEKEIESKKLPKTKKLNLKGCNNEFV